MACRKPRRELQLRVAFCVREHAVRMTARGILAIMVLSQGEHGTSAYVRLGGGSSQPDVFLFVRLASDSEFGRWTIVQ